MTQEEKVKRYDEALHKAKNYYSTTDSSSDIKLIGLIFPELKESDDEKIRKALVEMVHDTTGDSLWIDYNVHKEDALDWLEKQGKQKSIDKVEPKFKQEEWITNGDYTWKIVCVTDLDYILQSQDGNIVDDTISYVDEQFHSFTIEDAKDGDVLSYRDGQWIFIYKKLVDGDTFCYHALYSTIHQDLTIDDAAFTLLGSAIISATKEQRDILMKAMADAGYTFDFEKKELKKIKQNPAWSEEDEVKINRIVACLENLNVADNDILLKDVDWLKSLKDRYTWKPSDEQMERLKGTINSLPHQEVLYSLYQDLKKLK